NALRVVPALQGNILEHVEGFDYGDAAGAGRWGGENFPAMGVDGVTGVEGFANFRLVMGEIIEGDESAKRGHVASQHPRGLALIKLGGAVPGDALEGGSEFRLAQRVSGVKELAAVQEDAAAHREALQAGALFLEFAGKFFAYGKTLFGQADGGLHHVCEFHGAMRFQRERKPRDRARYGDGAIADGGSLFV